MHTRRPLAAAIALALSSFATLPATAQQTAATGTDAVTLDTMVVRAQLESQMRAVEVKRAADAIQDTVSSDSMGQYPDKNVGESVSRLPGISVTRDQGEGRFVVVRGLDAGLNSVTVDGVAVGTPEDATRAAPLDVIPSDSTERLTVVKSPTPDMPGDSVGGAIQVESASAFDRAGRSIRAKAEMSHQVLSGKTSPKAAFNYSDRFAGDTFGLALGLSHQDRDYESDNIETEYEKASDLGLDGDDLVAIETQQRKYAINRERTGLNLNLDWRPDGGGRYYLRTLFTDFTDAESRQNSIIPFGEGDYTANGDGTYSITGIPADEFSRRIRWRTKEEQSFTTSVGGENRIGAATIDYKIAYTQMRERVDDEVEARFEYEADEDVAILLDQSGAIPRYTIDDDPAGGWLRNGNYSLDRLVVAPIRVDDDETSAQVNLRFDGERVGWKAGLLGRWRDRDVDVDEVELRRGPAIDLASWTLDSPGYTHGDMGDGISAAAMNAWLRDRLGEYSARPQDVAANTEVSLVEDYVASEDILAGYLMATVDLGDLRVIAGARVERTETDATGNVFEYADSDEEVIGSITTRRATSTYTNVLPGLHMRYDLGDWVFRGAANRTIGRPAFGDLSPRARINRDQEEVDLGNPQLDPYESTNLDASFERYIGDAGILSIGLFHKDIAGYIAEVTTQDHPDYPGFEVTTPVNGEDASVLGVELNWQQHFGSGLLLGASGTWLDTEFELPAATTAGARAGETFSLPRSSDRLASAHVGYEKGRLSTRVAAVYRSEYLEEIGDEQAYDIWVAANTQLDFTLDWKAGDGVSVFLEASNLLDEPLELYQGREDRVLQNELYGRTYAAGVKINF